MLKGKKVIPVLLVVIMLFLTSSLGFAKTDELTDMVKKYESSTLTKEILENENYIIIDSEEKAKAVAEEDLKKIEYERAKELSKIPSYIKEKYKEFENLNGKYTKSDPTFKSKKPGLEEVLFELKSKKLLDFNYTNDEILKDFKTFLKDKESNLYSQEIKISTNNNIDDSTLKEHLIVLRTNTVEDAILSAFKVADYPVSHDMFLHSLTKNPKNLYYQIEGVQAYKGNFGTMNIAPSIKYGFLENPGFLTMLRNFARAGSSELNRDGYHYEFNNGDLAYSIHGTTNIRLHRMKYDRAFFRIWDIYDFDGLLNKILNLTTNTNIYGITIEGLHDGSIR